MPKISKHRMRLPAEVTPSDIEFVNEIYALGRRYVPPPGTILELERNPEIDAPWRFAIVRWEVEELVARRSDLRRFGIVGLQVATMGHGGVEGRHFLLLGDLAYCTIVALPDDSPPFTSWPAIVTMNEVVPVRFMHEKDAVTGWAIALEV